MDSDHKTLLTIGSNGDAGCKVSLAAANFYHLEANTPISNISTVSLLILCHNNELAILAFHTVFFNLIMTDAVEGWEMSNSLLPCCLQWAQHQQIISASDLQIEFWQMPFVFLQDQAALCSSLFLSWFLNLDIFSAEMLSKGTHECILIKNRKASSKNNRKLQPSRVHLL